MTILSFYSWRQNHYRVICNTAVMFCSLSRFGVSPLRFLLTNMGEAWFTYGPDLLQGKVLIFRE